MKSTSAAIAAVVLLLVASQAHAGAIIDFNSFTDGFVWNGDTLGGPGTWGQKISVNGSVTVVGLGVFDWQSDGLSATHEVGLWTEAGALLATTSVGPGSILATPSASGAGQYVYSAILPVTLTTGQYRYGAYYGAGNGDRVIFNAQGVFSDDPALTYDGSVGSAGGALIFPTANTGARDRYFGPALITRSAPQAVPLPSAAWAGLGLLGVIGAVRRHRRRKAA